MLNTEGMTAAGIERKAACQVRTTGQNATHAVHHDGVPQYAM
jgi:hypothetical protein